MLIIIPAVDQPVGRVPSFFDLEIIPKIRPSNEGTNKQHVSMPIILKMPEATANPSVSFCAFTTLGLTGVY